MKKARTRRANPRGLHWVAWKSGWEAAERGDDATSCPYTSQMRDGRVRHGKSARKAWVEGYFAFVDQEEMMRYQAERRS